jgi:TonB-linked SusC/RagA family outer membrane protein
MKRNVFLTFLMFVFVGFNLHAQGYEVTGKVTSAEDGAVLPGVSVVVQGTTIGTVTNFDGEYAITVPQRATSLMFSFVGMRTTEVALDGSTTINVEMESDALKLDEVVVTAIGIARDAKALGYGVETVSEDQISKSSRTSVIDALGGKVAGVRLNRASGEAGASTFIEIRGSASLTRSNQPLFVVDGVPIDNSGNTGNTVDGVSESNRAIDINPDDVADISILKGGAATALYGIRAANGAVIITTKSGKRSTEGVRVNYSGSVRIEQVSQLPPLQKKYAQGSEIYMGFFDRTGVQMGDEGIYNAVSWGPAFEDLRYTTDPSFVPGNEYAYGGMTPMDEYIEKWDPNGRLVPADHPLAGSQVPSAYDHYDFFQTGVSYKNHIDISGGDAVSTFYMSFSNNNNEGVVPNNTFDKTSFKLSGTRDVSSKLSVGASMNYVNSEGNRIQKGSNISGIMLGLLRTPPSFDNSYGYQFADGSQRSYRGGGGYDNPYWTANNILYNDKVDRLLGNFHINYLPTDWMSFTYRLGADIWTKDVKDYFEIGSNAFPTGQVTDCNCVNKDFNSDLIMSIQKQLSPDLGFTLTAGNNIFQSAYTYTRAIAFGLTELEFYNMNNSSDVRGYEGSNMKRTAAFYGDVALDFKGMLFLNATGRQEWSTTMPADNNSFFYPSVSAGFVFTELPGLQGNPILPFAKLRASYAQIANDAALYRTDNYYFRASPGDGWTNGLTYPFRGVNAFTLGGTIGNTNLRPETMNSMEVGVDLRFLEGRLGLDVTYFNNENNDLLLPQEIAPSTGYGAQYVNAGSMRTYGFELRLNATPVKTANFSWDILATWSNPYSEVTELADNVPNLFLSGFVEPQVRAVEGEAYRTLFGLNWARDENGNILINDNPGDAIMDGFPQSDPEMQAQGSVMPDWTAGITNVISYRGISLSALIDIKKGGLMWNGTKGALYYFGTHKDTEARGETKVWEGVNGHVNIDGDVVHLDGDGNEVAGPGAVNTTEVVIDEDWYWWSGEGSGFTGPSEPYVEEADWVRLRELTLSYAIPSSVLGNGLINNLEVYFTGINLWLSTPYTGVDPETSLVGNNNGLGIDYFNNPGTKSFTFGLRVGF